MTLVPAPMKDEIGHNLGLHHSGADTNQYADEIGQVRIIKNTRDRRRVEGK